MSENTTETVSTETAEPPRDEIPETLDTAARIRMARGEKGWSQTRLSQETYKLDPKHGVTQANISRYEKGIAQPQASTVDLIMRAIGKVHGLAAVDGVLGIQGRSAGKLNMVDPTATPRRIDWIVEGFVARGFLTMLAGEPGAGKSMATQTLATALVEGKEEVAGFALHTPKRWTECDLSEACPAVDAAPAHSHKLPAPARVMVLDAENGANLIQERVQSMGLDEETASRYMVATSDGFDIYKDRKDLYAMIGDYRDAGTPIDLLVIDSFTSMWFGNENVVDQVGPCLKMLNDLAAKFDLGILLIHHTDKEGDNYRGSSAIAATIGGGVFTFSRYDDKESEDITARCITCKKMRIAAEPVRRRVYVTGHGIDDKPDTTSDNLARAIAQRDAE